MAKVIFRVRRKTDNKRILSFGSRENAENL